MTTIGDTMKELGIDNPMQISKACSVASFNIVVKDESKAQAIITVLTEMGIPVNEDTKRAAACGMFFEGGINKVLDEVGNDPTSMIQALIAREKFKSGEKTEIDRDELDAAAERIEAMNASNDMQYQ